MCVLYTCVFNTCNILRSLLPNRKEISLCDMTDTKAPFYHLLSGNTEEDKKLLESLKYMCERTQNHNYIKITQAFNHWFKISPDKIRQIDEIIFIMFNSCLMLDDIQDNAVLRDGYPVTHNVYGRESTINAASYAQFIAFEKLHNLHPAAVKITVEQLLKFNRGQGMDMFWKEYFICPTEEEYKIMAIRKSIWLTTTAVNVMKLFSSCDKDFTTLLSFFAFYYQLYNDYYNLCFEDVSDDNYCDDVTEGKFSFPIIHAIHKYPGNRQILSILKQRTTDMDKKRYCVKLLQDFGSLQYTRDILEQGENEIIQEIERLGGNPLFMKFLGDQKIKMLAGGLKLN